MSRIRIQIRTFIVGFFLCLSSVPVTQAEETLICPSGSANGWSWQADYTNIKLENPALKIEWTTSGQPQKFETTGFRIEAFVTDGDNVRAIRLYLPGPTFTIEHKGYGDNLRKSTMFSSVMFRPAPEDFDPNAPTTPEHDYGVTAFAPTETGGTLIFSGRLETWKPARTKEITAQWLQEGPTSLGWPIRDQKNIAFLISTQHFQPKDYYGRAQAWDKIASTKAVDLSTLGPALDAAIVGQKQAWDFSKRTNKFCTKPDPPK